MQAHHMVPRCGATCTRCTPLCAFGRGGTRWQTLHMAWFEPDHYITEGQCGLLHPPLHADALGHPHARRQRALGRSASAHRPRRAAQRRPAARWGEALWLTYYRHIFNPARLQAHHDEKEMPTRYWHNLPEAALITELAQTAHERSAKMVEAEATVPRRRIAGKKHGRKKSHPAGARQRAERGGDASGFASATQPENPGINAGVPCAPCTWRWAISSAVAARTAVTLQLNFSAWPARGWLPSRCTSGPLILTTLNTAGLSVVAHAFAAGRPPSRRAETRSWNGAHQAFVTRTKGVFHRQGVAKPRPGKAHLGKMFFLATSAGRPLPGRGLPRGAWSPWSG